MYVEIIVPRDWNSDSVKMIDKVYKDTNQTISVSITPSMIALGNYTVMIRANILGELKSREIVVWVAQQKEQHKEKGEAKEKLSKPELKHAVAQEEMESKQPSSLPLKDSSLPWWKYIWRMFIIIIILWKVYKTGRKQKSPPSMS